MPHVVLDRQIDLEEIRHGFEPIISKGRCLIKIENVFVDAHKRCALFPAVTIGEESQSFLIEVLSGAKKTTVRLFPPTDPKKTPDVKSALGLAASYLIKQNGGAAVSRTNIGDFIPA